MDSKKRFSNRVDNYVKYRPTYPQQCINYLFQSIGLNKNSIVADIGSGTGIFSKLLVDKVKKLYGVEPNKEMREASEKYITGRKNFMTVDAPSENTTLDSNRIDFVTCAQSFHWFDMEKTKIEFKRILKLHGKVILIWNTRLYNIDKFSRQYELIIKRYSSDYENVDHKKLSIEKFIKFFRNGKYIKAEFGNQQKLDFNGFKGRTLSSSYMPLKGDKNYEQLISDLYKLFESAKVDNTVTIKYRTEVYTGEL